MLLALGLTATMAHSTDADPSTKADLRIRIGSRPAQYLPTRSMYLKPLSLEAYHFEASPETGRARIVIDYDYPLLDVDRSDAGPAPTEAELPGLTWNPVTRSVVYEADGKRTVCAIARLGRRLKLSNTGACTVTATEGEQTADGGWNIYAYKTIDTWLVVN